MDRLNLMESVLKQIANLIVGLVLSLLAYLIEIRGSVHLMWIAMIIDLFVGLLKSRYADKKTFEMIKFFQWLVFVFIATALISLVYAVELELIKVQSPSTYLYFTLIITGFVIVNIVRNGEKLTNKYIFTIILDELHKLLKKLSNIDFKKYEKNKDNNDLK